MDTNTTEKILCALLDCGSLDLAILEDTEYDIEDIVYGLQESEMKPTLGNIFEISFSRHRKNSVRHFNYLDSSISLRNKEIYQKFIPAELENIEKHTGFDFIEA